LLIVIALIFPARGFRNGKFEKSFETALDLKVLRNFVYVKLQ